MAIPFGTSIPFIEMLGCELQEFGGGRSLITLAPRPEHLNAFAVVHGGVIMTLHDVTMAAAARSATDGMGAITIEMKTSFMRAAKAPLRAEGRLIHRTKSMAFTEATIFDAEGVACSHATGTFKYVPGWGASAQPAAQVPTD
jgi:uncharacterized protein (TIGR00369 family)